MSVGLPWVNEHPDVFGELAEISEEGIGSPRLPAPDYRAREMNVVSSSGDSGHIPSDQEEETWHEVEDSLSSEGMV